MRRTRRRRSIGVLAVLLLGAACTTVERSTDVAAGPGVVMGDGDGSTVTVGDGAEGAIAPDGTPVTGGSSSTGGGRGGGGGRASGGGGGAGAASGGTASQGGAGGQRCPIEGPLKLGVSYSSDLAAGLAAVGQPDAAAQAANYGEQVQQTYQIAVDDLNANGGVAGCEVQLVFHDFSSLASDGFDGQSQKECAKFAEDERVFAAFSAALESNVLVECLASNGVVSFFNGAEYAPVQRDFERYRGFLYQPSQINPSRWGSFIDHFASNGLLPRGAKVGLLIADDGTGNAQHLANDVWIPKLEALDIEVVPYEYNWIRSYATVSDTSTAFSAAVLQFKAQGVTHVMSTPDGQAMAFFFTPQAESQSFRPAYRTAPNAGGTATIAPEGQRSDWASVQASWLGIAANYPDDMNDDQQATNPPNDARQRCDAVYAGKIQGPNISHGWCDTLWFLRAALEGASEITPASLLAGAERLGTGFQLSAGFGGSKFGMNRYDGVSQVRIARWDEGQGDYVYASPVLDAP